MTDIYLRLDYQGYKHLEKQLRNWQNIETSHTTVDGYYHKALRLDLGGICLEIQGPSVKKPVRDDTTPDHDAFNDFIARLVKATAQINNMIAHQPRKP
jgi:hypothetical protein